MNNNKEIRNHIKKYCGLSLELNHINLIEAISELEAVDFWNNISSLKGVPSYYFSNGILISYNE